MLQLLMHHVGRTNLTGIRNCHVEGLHSIMLHDEAGNRVRMYVANNANTHSNYLSTNYDVVREMDYDEDDPPSEAEVDDHRYQLGYEMSLGLHGHHCEVRLEVLTGTLYNITADIEPYQSGSLREYEYISPITGVGRVSDSGRRYRVVEAEPKAMGHGESVILNVEDLHTVHADGFVSWLVYERGESTEDNVSSFYSYNPHVPNTPANHMYQPMESSECQALIARVIGQYNRELEAVGAEKSRAAKEEEARANLIAVREAMDQGAAALDVRAPRSPAQSRLFKAACNYSADVANQWASEGLTNEDWAAWVDVVRSPNRRALSKTEFAAWRLPRLLSQVRRNSFAEVAEDPRQAVQAQREAMARMAEQAEQMTWAANSFTTTVRRTS